MKPINLVASMVLEDGHRWGEVATEDQWADMEALLDSPGGPRRHFWLRPRGGSKTFDTGAATLAMMIEGGIKAGDEMYAAAAGKDQAGLLARKIASVVENTPGLSGAAEVQQHKVITPSTGAVLEVLSSELSTSWGKTPRWLFIDEVCNHESGEREQRFVDALLTSLIKRRDSVCVAASTPSSPEHWSYALWQRAVRSKLWRASHVTEPAPWQDPEELEDERESLPEFLFNRLFLCVWTAAGDAIADAAALAECTGHAGPLAPQPGVEYVVAFDLSNVKDLTSVAVCHIEPRSGRPCVTLDRLEAWTPPKGGSVDLGDVDAFIRAASREYGGAPIVGDPWQAWKAIQAMQADGFRVKAVPFNPTVNSRRAQMLLRLVRDRDLDIPDDEQLRKEFLSLRLAEGSTPGVLKLITDGSSKGHYDRVMSLMLCAEELLSRPQGSWREYCGSTTECANCHTFYRVAAAACYRCQVPNPDYVPRREPVRREPELAAAQPGSWASAYWPKDAMRCENGHLYSASEGACRQCTGGSGYSGTLAPASFTRALALRR